MYDTKRLLQKFVKLYYRSIKLNVFFSTAAEKVVQNFGALRAQYTAVNHRTVVEPLLKQREHTAAAPRLGVFGAVPYLADAGIDHSTGTHRTGLQRHI